LLVAIAWTDWNMVDSLKKHEASPWNIVMDFCAHSNVQIFNYLSLKSCLGSMFMIFYAV
jgi:hypothetical protein